MEKQTSDHCLLILDTELEGNKLKRRFCFDQRWPQWREIDEVVEKAWKEEQQGTLMFQVCSRIKSCRVALLKWNKGHDTNSAKQIKNMKLEIEELNKMRGGRDWQK